MKLKNLTKTLLLSLMVVFAACKKDDTNTTLEPRSDFSISTPNWFVSTTFNFNNKATYAQTYLWDFGDGVKSQNPNPSHKYNSPGDYTVKLTVTNQNGKSAVFQRTITVLPIPTKAKLKAVQLNTISLSGWDVGSGPDIGFNMYNGSTLKYANKEIKLDVVASMLPLNWTISNAVSIGNIPADKITISFFDDDNGVGSVMGNIEFSLEELSVNSYPETVKLKSGTIDCVLTFEYE